MIPMMMVNQIGPNVIGITLDPAKDVVIAPTQFPTDPFVDEGESDPTEDVEEVTSLAPNDPFNDGGNSCH